MGKICKGIEENKWEKKDKYKWILWGDNNILMIKKCASDRVRSTTVVESRKYVRSSKINWLEVGIIFWQIIKIFSTQNDRII